MEKEGEPPSSEPEEMQAAEGEGFKVPSISVARKDRAALKMEGPSEAKSNGKQEEDCIKSSSKSASQPLGVEEGTTGKESATPILPLPYNEPLWSDVPSKPFFLSLIKHGTVIKEITLTDKSFHVFGRLPSCDIQLEHPSISRYHAVLQYRPQDGSPEDSEESDSTATDQVTSLSVSTNPKEEGFYVYDLGSTHGTFINKSKIQMRCFYRLRIGQMVRFGGSSRLFLLESKGGDQTQVESAAEAEIKEIVEVEEKLERRRAELEARQRLIEKEREDMGVMWGIVTDDLPSELGEGGEDYEIDEEKEAFYKDDPKKALKKFFDREGLELEYETEEEGPPRARVFTVRVRLPIETAAGESVYAEASLKGKKKDAVVLCALNACRMLDAQDMLRHHAQARKPKEKNWEENDYYDSDEDTFLDRTGTIERKRKKRMKKAGALEDTAENFESLEAKLKQLDHDITSIEKTLSRDTQFGDDELTGVDSLEAYMANIGSHLDKGKQLELKHQLHSLKNEKQSVIKLMEIVRRTKLPELKSPTLTSSPAEPTVMPSKPAKTSPQKPPISQQTAPTHNKTAPVNNEAAPMHNKTSPMDNETTPDPTTQPKSTRSRAGQRRKKPRLIGPAGLPPSEPPVSKLAARDDKEQEEGDKSDFADWLPPEKQTGDGRTHLNEKFGY